MKELEVKNLPIDKVRANSWNPNQMDAKTMAKLKSDIQRRGFVQPILVRQTNDDEWEIIDGYHRWSVLHELGYKEVPAIVIDMDDTEAKLKTIQLNYMRGNAVPIRLANLIHDLNKTMTLEDLEAALPYEKAELKDSLDLLKLPTDIDKVVEERAEKERRAEPIFISATIYKDKEKSLHDFVEQALLESEATFAEIKIKIECPAGDHDLVLNAMQNLKKLDRGKDDLEGENAPIVTRFALFPEQLQIVDRALQHIIRTQGYMKNPRGMALEMMAADYLAGAASEGDEDEGLELSETVSVRSEQGDNRPEEESAAPSVREALAERTDSKRPRSKRTDD
ncbi:ParB/RepB/Spo0J family partition protein [Biomaibacter acetigenes]|uniref:ParB/RepB/Spo0J family partition protein n=1 Tax=Biomaibacter acetigenes TaxID=2316383 RepID=A0A3G2R5F2_9FIRM|nr:ParB/RepB/Spo0J family partition protein [Biomaibacter acetigenes]AYO30609.1 ParB/RepB/Spo0J family partition protein [Biomaibacter acetigenes]